MNNARPTQSEDSVTPRPAFSAKRASFFLLTLIILALCAYTLLPFSTAIIGAIVLAIACQRPYAWLSRRIRHRSTCAAVALVILILVAIIPAFFLAQELSRQTLALVASVRPGGAAQQHIVAYIADHPRLASSLETFTVSLDVPGTARSIGTFLGRHTIGAVGESISAITQVVIMLFLLFFLLRDRDLALCSLRRLSPLSDEETDELLHRTGETIFATALGRVTIAVIQGVLAGLAFWVLDVPGVILWAFTLTVCAMIPAFGAFLVWGPIALYLGFNGHWGKAALLAVWGGLIVSTIDNILYPILVGSHLRTHTSIILISILGGIAVFGPIGIVVGPVLFTIAATLLEFWHKRIPSSASSSA